MEVDFMEHQARFLNSGMSILLLMLFTGCKQPGKHAVEYKTINAEAPGIKALNGIVYYNEQLFNGTLFALFPNSNDTAAIMNFHNGREDGVWKKKYANNALEEKREFKNGKKTGEYIAWWPNGNKKLRYEFKEGEYEGTCYEWNEQGQMTKEANYKAGYEDGLQKIFYNNGKIHSNFVVVNGRRYGLLGTKNCINVSDSIFN
jgi:antitoxin component YwqK of YwqJK toxin-antitoxin module